MSRSLATCVLITLGALAPPSHAAILQMEDWKTPGDHLLLADSATGLQWLKLDASLGLSHVRVDSQLGPSGLFAGFRYATGAEVATLANHAGITSVGSQTSDPTDVGALIALGKNWCWTFGSAETGFRGSFLVADESDGKYGLGQFFVSPPPPYGAFPLYGYLYPVDSYVEGNLAEMPIGSALVRETPVVPEPASLVVWSFLVAGIALITWQRRGRAS